MRSNFQDETINEKLQSLLNRYEITDKLFILLVKEIEKIYNNIRYTIFDYGCNNIKIEINNLIDNKIDELNTLSTQNLSELSSEISIKTFLLSLYFKILQYKDTQIKHYDYILRKGNILQNISDVMEFMCYESTQIFIQFNLYIYLFYSFYLIIFISDFNNILNGNESLVNSFNMINEDNDNVFNENDTLYFVKINCPKNLEIYVNKLINETYILDGIYTQKILRIKDILNRINTLFNKETINESFKRIKTVIKCLNENKNLINTMSNFIKNEIIQGLSNNFLGFNPFNTNNIINYKDKFKSNLKREYNFIVILENEIFKYQYLNIQEIN